MHQSYKRLLNANPKVRLSVSNFRDQGRRSGGFFDTPLVKLAEGIESLGLKSEGEREEFLKYVREEYSQRNSPVPFRRTSPVLDSQGTNPRIVSLMRFRMIFLKNSLPSRSYLSSSNPWSLEVVGLGYWAP